jgi:CBS domain-containing protein
MRAADLMTTNVVTVGAQTPVHEIATLLLTRRISAVPVVNQDHRLVGIVSEGDLMRRPENDTERRHSWWLAAIASRQQKAGEYIKAHGQTAGEVMTSKVFTVTADTPAHEIATLLETHHVKRVPVVEDGRVVGIVSRANLLHGLAATKGGKPSGDPVEDRTIRDTLNESLSEEIGMDMALVNVVVDDGVVQLWGLVKSGIEKKAAEVAAENVDGVKKVQNYLGQVPEWVMGE